MYSPKSVVYLYNHLGWRLFRGDIIFDVRALCLRSSAVLCGNYSDSVFYYIHILNPKIENSSWFLFRKCLCQQNVPFSDLQNKCCRKWFIFYDAECRCMVAPWFLIVKVLKSPKIRQSTPFSWQKFSGGTTYIWQIIKCVLKHSMK